MTVEADIMANPSARTRPGAWLRWAPLALMAIALALIVASGVGGRLSLLELGQRRSALIDMVHRHPVESLAAYVGAYLLVVALSLPGALILTLTGGFLFGLWLGTGAAVVGASAGAVVMFLAARTALGESVRRRAERAGGLVQTLERAIRANAFSALLSARLMPALPIWTVNIAAAMVEMRLGPYAAATVLGIAPSTFIYAGVGAGLGRIFDRGERPDLRLVMQPHVIAPLVGLAVLAAAPLLWRAWRVRRMGGESAR